jgi:hypothetical protein
MRTVLNGRSREVRRQQAPERDPRGSAGVPKCGGWCAKPAVIANFNASIPDRESWSQQDWRRERNWDPTVFANRVVVCKPLQALPFGQENGWQDSLFAPRSAPRPPQGGVRNGNRCINLLESVLVTNHGGSGRPLDDVTRPLRPAGRIRRNGSLAY